MGNLKYIGYPFNNPLYPQGNGNIMVIKKSGSFQRWQHDTLTFEGKYFLKEKKDCYQNNTDIIFYTNENTNASYRYIQIINGKLILSTLTCYEDGGDAFYRRLE